MADTPPLTIQAAVAWLGGIRPESRAARLTEFLNESEDLDFNARLVTMLRELGIWPQREKA